MELQEGQTSRLEQLIEYNLLTGLQVVQPTKELVNKKFIAFYIMTHITILCNYQIILITFLYYDV